MKHISGDDVINFFQDKDLSDESLYYLKFHRKRFAYLINFVSDNLQTVNLKISEIPDFNILDVGGSPQTALLRHYFTDDVSTLDIHEDETTYCNSFGEKDFIGREYFAYDLHDVLDSSRHILHGQFSAIVMSEVVEHVLVSPKAIFSYMHKLLKDDGLLFIQTPNGAGLKQRLLLLSGTNPSALPPDTNEYFQYGHIREYTFNELITMGKEAGFTVIKSVGCNYFQVYDNFLMNLYNTTCNKLLPYFLRSGISICFQKN